MNPTVNEKKWTGKMNWKNFFDGKKNESLHVQIKSMLYFRFFSAQKFYTTFDVYI